MCSSTAFSVVGAGVSFLGGLGQANAQEAAGEAQGQAFDLNAAIARQNAKLAAARAVDALERGSAEKGRSAATARQEAGLLATRFAGSGVSIDFGTAVESRGDQAAEAVLAQRVITNNARREEFEALLLRTDFLRQQMFARFNAAQARAAGKAAARGTRFKAFAGLLADASKSGLFPTQTT